MRHGSAAAVIGIALVAGACLSTEPTATVTTSGASTTSTAPPATVGSTVIIPLLTRASVGAVWADRVQGYVHSPWLVTWNVENWSHADL